MSNNLIQGQKILFNILNEFLEKIDQEVYLKKINILNNYAIGDHIRHIIEFYICLTNIENDVIQYEKRERNAKISSDKNYALNKLKTIYNTILKLNLDRKIIVFEDEIKMESSISRELFYANEHAVHHLAIIKMAILTINPNYNLPENFGIAPSTVRHNKKCVQ